MLGDSYPSFKRTPAAHFLTHLSVADKYTRFLDNVSIKGYEGK